MNCELVTVRPVSRLYISNPFESNCDNPKLPEGFIELGFTRGVIFRVITVLAGRTCADTPVMDKYWTELIVLLRMEHDCSPVSVPLVCRIENFADSRLVPITTSGGSSNR